MGLLLVYEFERAQNALRAPDKPCGWRLRLCRMQEESRPLYHHARRMPRLRMTRIDWSKLTSVAQPQLGQRPQHPAARIL